MVYEILWYNDRKTFQVDVLFISYINSDHDKVIHIASRETTNIILSIMSHFLFLYLKNVKYIFPGTIDDSVSGTDCW